LSELGLSGTKPVSDACTQFFHLNVDPRVTLPRVIILVIRVAVIRVAVTLPRVRVAVILGNLCSITGAVHVCVCVRVCICSEFVIADKQLKDKGFNTANLRGGLGKTFE
jgi:hypothetical protein